MFNEFNPYTVLGVEKDASEADIKAAFRKLAQHTHPDQNKGSDEQFKEINRAYKLLMNPDERAYYDSTGDANRKTPQIDTMAFQCVINYFSKVASDLDGQIDPLKQDLIDCGKKFFAMENDQLEKQIIKYERVIVTFEKIEAKIKPKTKNSILKRGMQHQIMMYKNQVKNLQNQIMVNKRASEILDDHDFEKDPNVYIRMYPGYSSFGPTL